MRIAIENKSFPGLWVCIYLHINLRIFQFIIYVKTGATAIKIQFLCVVCNMYTYTYTIQ